MNDEFYIGWEAKAPLKIGQWKRKVVCILLLGSVVIPGVLAVSQRMIGQSVFEWGTRKNFSGVLRLEPYPHLLVSRPGNPGVSSPWSAYYLVAPWKFGLDRQALAPLNEQSVTLKGTLIFRGNQTMIETQPEWIARNNKERSAPLPTTIPLGPQTLRGEIVDSKCFLGVMNPGQLTPHRACAIRCISGGIPPVLLVRQKNGGAAYLLLVSAHGKAVNQEVLDLVAEPVEITGIVERQGELLILKANPADYRRVRSAARAVRTAMR